MLRGRLRVTVSPLLTRPAAARTRSGESRLSAPRSSSSPQRPQLQTASNSALNSAAPISALCVCTVRSIAGARPPRAPATRLRPCARARRVRRGRGCRSGRSRRRRPPRTDGVRRSQTASRSRRSMRRRSDHPSVGAATKEREARGQLDDPEKDGYPPPRMEARKRVLSSVVEVRIADRGDPVDDVEDSRDQQQDSYEDGTACASQDVSPSGNRLPSVTARVMRTSSWHCGCLFAGAAAIPAVQLSPRIVLPGNDGSARSSSCRGRAAPRPAAPG